MKKLAFLLSVLFIVSCEGPAGPHGPQGPPGSDGVIGQAFDEQIDFTSGNNYAELVPIPDRIEVYESDIVMVYLLWDDSNGIDVWQPLPATVFFGDGQLQYAFDFTIENVQIFLDGYTDFTQLSPEFTQGQWFRIVVLPAAYVQNNNIDLQNMEAVMKTVSPQNIQRLQAGTN